MTSTASSTIIHPQSPDDLPAGTLLGVSTSLKPPLGAEGNSAARSLLIRSLELIGTVYDRVALLDLRHHRVPLFDGRLPDEYDDEGVEFCHACIKRAGAVWLSAPAYWCGVSGVCKNLIDVLCGPDYELHKDRSTVFAGLSVGLLVVGTDQPTASLASEQIRGIMLSTGAELVGDPVLIADPRQALVNEQRVAGDLLVLGGELAKRAAGERSK